MKFSIEPEGWSNEIADLSAKNIDEYIKENRTLQGLVKKCDEKYNLHINLGNGIQGIIPREEVDEISLTEEGLPKANLCIGKVHKFVQFKVKDKKDDNILILSRKEVQKEALNWIKNELKQGDIVTGIVKSIKPYGAFVEIGGGIVGLVHIEDISIARIKTPFERLKIGQKIKIMIKSVDRKTSKVILSYKEVLGSWEENADKFEIGMVVPGIIRETERNKNGIFIELTPNLVGMAEYEQGYKYGQNVEVFIKKIDRDRKKVKLNIKK